MIAFLEGTLKAKSTESIYLQVGGVGYQIYLPLGDLAQLPALNTDVFIYTYLQVKEDNFTLFGFLNLEEKNLFEKLITVSGVGPKVALAALSTFKPAELVEALSSQEVDLVSRIPGVGKKLASRMVLELKDALTHFSSESSSSGHTYASSAINAAQEALESMGFSAAEITQALQGVDLSLSEAQIIQYALKRIGA